MLISYSGEDQVLVTTSQLEKDFLYQYFILGQRDLEEYDRVESAEVCVEVSSSLRAD